VKAPVESSATKKRAAKKPARPPFVIHVRSARRPPRSRAGASFPLRGMTGRPRSAPGQAGGLRPRWCPGLAPDAMTKYATLCHALVCPPTRPHGRSRFAEESSWGCVVSSENHGNSFSGCVRVIAEGKASLHQGRGAKAVLRASFRAPMQRWRRRCFMSSSAGAACSERRRYVFAPECGVQKIAVHKGDPPRGTPAVPPS